MYLREKTILFYKICNVIIAAAAIFNIIISVAMEVYLVVRYWGDPDTILHAKATPEFFFWCIAGVLLLIHVIRSKNRIGDATFYSSYFESDLDGYVSAGELAEVTGKKVKKIKKYLKHFPLLYMKNYTFTGEGAELASKTVTCDCLSCGGIIEKKIYFTGECPYCGSSDLQARILTDGKFLHISNELKGKPKSSEYYKHNNLTAKKAFFAVLLGLSLFVITICVFIAIDNIVHYNDKEYLNSILLDPDSHLQSYELIHYEMIYSILACFAFIIGLIPVAINRLRRLGLIGVAEITAPGLARCKTPFISPKDLPTYKSDDEARKIDHVRRTIKAGYLKHCTLEKHSGELKLALAKKIVKDRCPNCGGPIVGAADADYICRYCDSKIMDVVVKK